MEMKKLLMRLKVYKKKLCLKQKTVEELTDMINIASPNDIINFKPKKIL